MRRLLGLICAALMLATVLSGCMTETEHKVKEVASEASSGLKKAATEMGIDDPGTRRITSTDGEDMTERDLGENIEDAVDSMIEDGFYDQWYENALVQLIFKKDFKLYYIDISSYEWTEVDSVNDLLAARRIHGRE